MPLASSRSLRAAPGFNPMRHLLTIIILAMLAQPAWASTNRILYDSCKPYADRGFDIASTDDVVGIYSDGVCLGYILATIEQLQNICKVYDWAKTQHSDRPDLVNGARVAAMAHGTSATIDDSDAVIQLFINYAAANPTEWEYTPDATDWLTQAFPCKE